MARLAASELVIDSPSGPAIVTATLPDVGECPAAGTNGCWYRIAVTFEESNTLDLIVTRIGIRWIERNGNTWWINRAGEFDDVDLFIAADGTAFQGASIFVDPESTHRRIIGGRLRVRYNGTDAEGNSFRGDLSIRLERPSESSGNVISTTTSS